MKELLKKLSRLLDLIEKRYSRVYFFALVRRYDIEVMEQWDLLISAKGLTSDKEGFSALLEMLEELGFSNLDFLASISILDSNEEIIDAFRSKYEYIETSWKEPVELTNYTYGNFSLGHVFLFKLSPVESRHLIR